MAVEDAVKCPGLVARECGKTASDTCPQEKFSDICVETVAAGFS